MPRYHHDATMREREGEKWVSFEWVTMYRKREKEYKWERKRISQSEREKERESVFEKDNSVEM